MSMLNARRQGDAPTASAEATVAVLASCGGTQIIAFAAFCIYLYFICLAWRHGIFFYKSVFSALSFAVLVSILLFRLARSEALGGLLRRAGLYPVWFSIAKAVVHFLLVLVFLLLVPVIADRSISVFLLGSLDRAGIVSDAELEQRFVADYVHRYGAVARRIDEQIASGNVERTPGGYRLTRQGYFVVNGMRRVASAFSLDHRLTDPQTDAGTPP